MRHGIFSAFIEDPVELYGHDGNIHGFRSAVWARSGGPDGMVAGLMRAPRSAPRKDRHGQG